jgi:hypothetical protein
MLSCFLFFILPNVSSVPLSEIIRTSRRASPHLPADPAYFLASQSLECMHDVGVNVFFSLRFGIVVDDACLSAVE